MLPPKYFTPPSIRALKFSASAPIVVSASTPMRMPLMVRKLRSLWRATLRMISMGEPVEDTTCRCLSHLRVGEAELPEVGALRRAHVNLHVEGAPPHVRVDLHSVDDLLVDGESAVWLIALSRRPTRRCPAGSADLPRKAGR